MRMAVRREETWRPLNRQRVGAFVEMYLTALARQENAYRHPGEEKRATKLLKDPLVHRVIPFIYRNRVWTMDETLWPITLEHFKELDHHLADKLPRLRSGHQWVMIRHYFDEIEREQEEEKGM